MELLAGFLLGLLGTYLFWRYQVNVKPKIVISSVIAKGKSNGDNEKIVYRIKLYNNSNRPVINVSIGCSLSQAINVPGGKRSYGRSVHVVPKEFHHLGPKKNWGDIYGLNPVKILAIKDENALELMGSDTIFTMLRTKDSVGEPVWLGNPVMSSPGGKRTPPFYICW